MLKNLAQDWPTAYLTTSCVCVDSKVLPTKFLKNVENLVNGSVGFVGEIIHDVNETTTSSLTMHVLVDFGDTHTRHIFSQMTHQ